MNDEAEYSQKVEEVPEPDEEIIDTLGRSKREKRKPRAKKDTKATKKQIDELLIQLEGIIRGRGDELTQINKLRALAAKTSIKRDINIVLDTVSIEVKRKWYTKAYQNIGRLRGKVKEL